MPLNSEFETLWEQHNSKLNTLIGKATVPAMRSGDPLAKEVHRDLLELATWFDEEMGRLTTNATES
jgi:hypothetical protein